MLEDLQDVIFSVLDPLTQAQFALVDTKSFKKYSFHIILPSNTLLCASEAGNEPMVAHLLTLHSSFFGQKDKFAIKETLLQAGRKAIGAGHIGILQRHIMRALGEQHEDVLGLILSAAYWGHREILHLTLASLPRKPYFLTNEIVIAAAEGGQFTIMEELLRPTTPTSLPLSKANFTGQFNPYFKAALIGKNEDCINLVLELFPDSAHMIPAHLDNILLACNEKIAVPPLLLLQERRMLDSFSFIRAVGSLSLIQTVIKVGAPHPGSDMDMWMEAIGRAPPEVRTFLAGRYPDHLNHHAVFRAAFSRLNYKVARWAYDEALDSPQPIDLTSINPDWAVSSQESDGVELYSWYYSTRYRGSRDGLIGAILHQPEGMGEESTLLYARVVSALVKDRLLPADKFLVELLVTSSLHLITPLFMAGLVLTLNEWKEIVIKTLRARPTMKYLCSYLLQRGALTATQYVDIVQEDPVFHKVTSLPLDDPGLFDAALTQNLFENRSVILYAKSHPEHFFSRCLDLDAASTFEAMLLHDAKCPPDLLDRFDSAHPERRQTLTNQLPNLFQDLSRRDGFHYLAYRHDPAGFISFLVQASPDEERSLLDQVAPLFRSGSEFLFALLRSVDEAPLMDRLRILAKALVLKYTLSQGFVRPFSLTPLGHAHLILSP